MRGSVRGAQRGGPACLLGKTSASCWYSTENRPISGSASLGHVASCGPTVCIAKGFRRHSGPSLRITPLEPYRRQVATGTVAAFRVVKHVDVVEHVSTRGIFR